MPARNVIKHYAPDYFYHIYNRGYQKNNIFFDQNDYNTFLNYVRRCTDPIKKNNLSGKVNLHNISEKLEIVSYCLMPNHFHFLIRLVEKEGITQFLRMILTAYTKYINTKYKREGGLFQGKPRGCLIETESYLLHLSRYIHLNPYELFEDYDSFKEYSFSSYKNYLGLKSQSWINPSPILDYFKSFKFSKAQFNNYEQFVKSYKIESEEILGNMILENP